MADRGFEQEWGECPLCGKPLGRQRDTMRVPIFDPYGQGRQDLAEYMGRAVHQDCWDLWDEADTVARLAIEVKARQFNEGLTLAQGEFTGAWGFLRQEVDFSPGSVFFAHSSMVYMEFGPYVGACAIEGRTVNVAAIVELVGAGRLVPGFHHFVPAQDGVPALELHCHGCENERLEVEFIGAYKKGLDMTCFLRLDDLQEMRDSLKNRAEGAAREAPAVYPIRR